MLSSHTPHLQSKVAWALLYTRALHVRTTAWKTTRWSSKNTVYLQW